MVFIALLAKYAMKEMTAIVLNPEAGDGQAGNNWPWAEKILRQHGIRFDTFETDNGENIVRSVKEIAEAGYGRIVGAGGDGTQNAVINGIMKAAVDERPEYGILPLGTANDIGKSFLYTRSEAYTSEIGTHALKALLKLDPTGLSTDFINLAVQNSHSKKGTAIEIQLDRNVESQIDGEEYRKGNHFLVECVRHALTLITPHEG
jgi:diacylglycerol kinase family enzyme